MKFHRCCPCWKKILPTPVCSNSSMFDATHSYRG